MISPIRAEQFRYFIECREVPQTEMNTQIGTNFFYQEIKKHKATSK